SSTAPIHLYLNSAGGETQSVLAVSDTLAYVRSRIAVPCVGQAVAAPVVLLAAGPPGRRSVLPPTQVVLHPLEAQGRGAVPDLILATEEVERIRRALESLIAQHSGQELERVRRDLERERVLDAAATVRYGLADEILLRRPPAA